MARSSLIIAMYGWRRFSLSAYKEHTVLLQLVRAGKLLQAKKSMTAHLQGLETQLRYRPAPAHYADPSEVFSLPRCTASGRLLHATDGRSDPR